jgi:hypothetical protein
MCTSRDKIPNPLDTCGRIDFPMEPPPAEILPPQKLPTPWLADSEWLLKELAKTRETILRVPFQLDNASDIKSAVDRLWSLEQTLRYLLHLHREGQRQFAKQLATEAAKGVQIVPKAGRKRTVRKSNIVRITA